MLHVMPYGKTRRCRTLFVQDSCKRHQHEGFSIIWNSRSSCKATLQSPERKQESSTEMPTSSPHVVSTKMLSGSFLYEGHFQPLLYIFLLEFPAGFFIAKHYLQNHHSTVVFCFCFLWLVVWGFLCTCCCSNQPLKQQCRIQTCSPNTVTWTWTASLGSN